MNISSRRKFLGLIAQLVAAGSVAGCGVKNNSDMAGARDSEALETLASIAYDLFPYENLDPTLYIKAAEDIQSRNSQLVEQGMARLRERVGTRPWADVREEERLRILSSLENSDFFALLRTATIETLFREPATWELIGYGGSAIEQGGYINRGFDDIDWLPEEASAQENVR